MIQASNGSNAYAENGVGITYLVNLAQEWTRPQRSSLPVMFPVTHLEQELVVEHTMQPVHACVAEQYKKRILRNLVPDAS